MSRNKGSLGLRHPFGEECCEAEIEILKDSYSDYYFMSAPFNSAAIDPDTYLIIGRRGSGKTSLSQYFKFQNTIKNCRCIDVDEPNVYYDVLSKVSELAATSNEVAIPKIVSIWEFVIWSLVFEEYKDVNEVVRAASHVYSGEKKGPAQLVRALLRSLLNACLGKGGDKFSDDLEEYISSPLIQNAKSEIRKLTNRTPVIVAIDSLERYSVDDEGMMRSTAALIQCASNFNIALSGNGIHVKVFVSAEVFPYLCESEISNTRKYVRDEKYLHWRPKDLVKLVCWRFYKYLSLHGQMAQESRHEIDWDKFSDVLEKMWVPYFGADVVNGAQVAEKTFPYVIRHTQMRPRQIITLLNAIARDSKADKNFPNFHTGKTIVTSVRRAEKSLATEVINSYSKAYKNVGKIVDALTGAPMLFKGSELDKRAHLTASEWPQGNYSPSNFKQLLAELGIVGRVRKWDTALGVIEADFEYALEDRLPLLSGDDCVIHPMFYEKLRINTASHRAIIYPFPDHPDFDDVR